MTEQSWIADFGGLGGIIGTVTGIIGAVTGILALQKAKSIKALDLRIELRKAGNEAIASLASLEKNIDDAKFSHRELLAQRGMQQSSMMEDFERQYQQDKVELPTLQNKIRVLLVGVSKLNHEELENRLIEIHAYQLKISKIAGHYSNIIAQDNLTLEHLREDRRDNLNRAFG